MKIAFYYLEFPDNRELFLLFCRHLRQMNLAETALRFIKGGDTFLDVDEKGIVTAFHAEEYDLILVAGQNCFQEAIRIFSNARFVFVRMDKRPAAQAVLKERLIGILNIGGGAFIDEHLPAELIYEFPLQQVEDLSTLPPQAPRPKSIRQAGRKKVFYRSTQKRDDLVFMTRIISAVNGMQGVELNLVCSSAEKDFLSQLSNDNILFNKEVFSCEQADIAIIEEEDCAKALMAGIIPILINRAGLPELLHEENISQLMECNSKTICPTDFVTAEYLSEIIHEGLSLTAEKKLARLTGIFNRIHAIHEEHRLENYIGQQAKLAHLLRSAQAAALYISLITDADFFFIESTKTYLLTGPNHKVLGQFDEGEYELLGKMRDPVLMETFVNQQTDYNRDELTSYLLGLCDQQILVARLEDIKIMA